MLRFPNPGSTIPNILYIYKVIYKEFKSVPSFNLDDMTLALTKSLLASSSGYIGGEALEASTRKDRSRDPLYNQSKMYAEVFRALGWISSISKDEALTFIFTLFGKYAGESTNLDRIFEEAILGIVYPNDVLDAKSNISTRPFLAILKAIAALGGYIYRDEMIIGPMCHNDQNADLMQSLVKITETRPDYIKLEKLLDKTSANFGIQINTMTNYTRFPIAAMEYCGWIKKESSTQIYNKKLKLMKLTSKGEAVLKQYSSYLDERYERFKNRQENLRKAIANVSFYSMLDRCNYDISTILDELNEHVKFLNSKSINKTPLFSPYQTLNKNEADKYLSVEDQNTEIIQNRTQLSSSSHNGKDIFSTKVHYIHAGESSLKNDFTNEIKATYKSTKNINTTINHIFKKYRTAKKETFYPLIGCMFCILGFDCKVSRPGVNYERFDAVIVDKNKSIPIEIKSPTEEEKLSVKAVRQALENKIILLSRKTYKTDFDTSTLSIGYSLPNNRADVYDLVKAIKKVYGIKIGIIDFKTLLTLCAKAAIENKFIDLDDIRNMEGILHV